MKKLKTTSVFVFCILLFVSYSNKLLSQNFSNRGTDFWVGHMGHIDGTGSNFKLYISSTVNTTGVVSVPLQGWSTAFTITANTFAIISIPSSVGYIGCSDCMQQRGIHIVSNDDVAVYAHIFASARSDATLLLPTSTLAKEYYANSYTASGGYSSEFLVVATEDSSQIQITPTSATLGGHAANVPFTVTLQQGEEYQVESNTDLTGSKILSISNNSTDCKKVAVFGGNKWTSIGCSGAGSGDNLYEEMYPLNTWGKNFVTSPFKSRVGDMFRVMAGINGTVVSINGASVSLNQAQFFDTLLVGPAFVTANNPITLAQYARTENCDGHTGDPLMIILSPVEQSINNVLAYNSPEQAITGEYINVVMKTADIGTCLIDGSAIPFNPVPFNPTYSYSQNTVTVGSHTIVADSGFNAIVYGFGSIESYGYLAGANIRNLQQQHFIVNTLNVHPACSGDSVSFTGVASYTPSSWKWDFGDATTSSLQNPIHVYADTGTYQVSLVTVYPNGCIAHQDSSSNVLHVYGTPHANFNLPVVCFGDSMVVADLSSTPKGGTINAWHWSFGDGAVSNLQNTGHTYATINAYDIKLVVTTDKGCADSITRNVMVHHSPTAGFSAAPVCFNDSSIFVDASVDSIATWVWNFGDGSLINTDSTPHYLYASAGTYNVLLKVTSIYGCVDSITKPVKVYYNPVAAFTANNVCLKDTVHFNNVSSVNNSSSIAYYSWVFGDASPHSSLQNPNHVYATSGTYSVSLLVKTVDSCSNTITHQVTVFDPPKTQFTFTNSCLFDSVLFTNTSLNPSVGSIAKWKWNFGDNVIIDSANWMPHHLYPLPGDYTVSLITYSSNLLCADTVKDTVTIFPMPIANFGTTEVCFNQLSFFHDSSTVSTGSVNSWSWNFGDTTSLGTAQNPTHKYLHSGIFSVTLVSTTNNGCKDTITKNEIIHPLPTVLFSAPNVCNGTTVVFTDNSSVIANPTNDAVHLWLWNFGDNSTLVATQQSSHPYNGAGTYPVQLIATSNFGCIDSISKNVVVNPNPVVVFSANDTVGCEPLCVSFQNTSFVTNGNVAHSVWNFGDNSATSSSQDAMHCYTNNNVSALMLFSPSLTVTSDSGCVSVLTKNNYITVYPAPVASFVPSPLTSSIVNPVISIVNLSTGADTTNWNFGDNQLSSVFSPPAHTYADTGTYTITLITSTHYGCIDTTYQTVIIEPDFIFYIPNSFTPNDDGINDTFTGQGIFIKDFEMSIYDRWGNLIFYSNDINKPWDGRANHGNELAQRDVYVYAIKVTDFKMVKHNYKGKVILVR
jgi:gliding motility-associated-like protein